MALRVHFQLCLSEYIAFSPFGSMIALGRGYDPTVMKADSLPTSSLLTMLDRSVTHIRNYYCIFVIPKETRLFWCRLEELKLRILIDYYQPHLKSKKFDYSFQPPTKCKSNETLVDTFQIIISSRDCIMSSQEESEFYGPRALECRLSEREWVVMRPAEKLQ